MWAVVDGTVLLVVTQIVAVTTLSEGVGRLLKDDIQKNISGKTKNILAGGKSGAVRMDKFPKLYHHYQYIITFVDDYMSMAWTTPLHTKDAALIATCHFLKMVSTQFKTQVEQWISDAGGEYKFKAFDSMLKEQGIHILQSAPHTPQQNGCAE